MRLVMKTEIIKVKETAEKDCEECEGGEGICLWEDRMLSICAKSIRVQIG
jgi:hypothetical protein